MRFEVIPTEPGGTTPMVWPSGTAWASAPIPIVLLAPERFSTSTGCPRPCDMPSAMNLTSTSAFPPGGNGTMMRIGRLGNVCASTDIEPQKTARPVKMRLRQKGDMNIFSPGKNPSIKRSAWFGRDEPHGHSPYPDGRNHRLPAVSRNLDLDQ